MLRSQFSMQRITNVGSILSCVEYQRTVRENSGKVQQLLKNKCELKNRTSLEADLNVRLGDI